MLRISEFAQLAHTTRRTLILYDKEELFKPSFVNNEGYRFYKYDKIGELNLILTLKKLGLSIPEIKEIKRHHTELSTEKLLNLKSKVNDQISDLIKVNTFIDRNLLDSKTSKTELYQPFEIVHQESFFWRSNISKACSPRQIAKNFSEFHHHLNQQMGINGNFSGFIIDLPQLDLNILEDTPFNLIKEAALPINNNFITTITRPAGNYLSIDIPSHPQDSCQNLQKGLNILRQIITDRNLKVESKLWHLDLGKKLSLPDISAIIRLEMLVEE